MADKALYVVGQKRFVATMRKAGFRAVTHKAFTLGICRMYTGEK